MTLHAAKGLEFPTTVFIDRRARRRSLAARARRLRRSRRRVRARGGAAPVLRRDDARDGAPLPDLRGHPPALRRDALVNWPSSFPRGDCRRSSSRARQRGAGSESQALGRLRPARRGAVAGGGGHWSSTTTSAWATIDALRGQSGVERSRHRDASCTTVSKELLLQYANLKSSGGRMSVEFVGRMRGASRSPGRRRLARRALCRRACEERSSSASH